MWPSGEARVSKTLNDGSNPSMTAHKQAIVKRGGVSTLPLILLIFFVELKSIVKCDH